MFCPNMGRYGNQLDQYVSMIHLSTSIDRQFILGPLIFYEGLSIELIPFASVFNISELRQQYAVVEMSQVDTSKLTTISCPRLAMEHGGVSCLNCGNSQVGCRLEGNPNEPYWSRLGFNFESSFDVTRHVAVNTIDKAAWRGIDNDIVLMSSFMRFPSTDVVNQVHRYLHFTDDIKRQVDTGLYHDNVSL